MAPHGAILSGPAPAISAQPASERTVSHALVDVLCDLGIREAFGIVGGAVAPFCDVLGKRARETAASPSPSPRVFAMRHEGGAAFAAVEASVASGRPSCVFTTTGPGLTNALTGVYAAKSEGARLVVVCGATGPAQRGRGAVQEVSDLASFGVDHVRGAFDVVVTLESAAELPAVANRLARGFSAHGGFTALIALPLSVQRALCPSEVDVRVPALRRFPVRAPAATMAEVLDAIADPYVLWVGRGAHAHAPLVRALAERTGARVMCTPRGKGIFPEDHGLFLGVTGFGGHAAVEDMLERDKPQRALVLGSRLGEYSSVWDERLVPEQGLIHVDLDPSAFGAAFPRAPTLPVVADIGAFLEDLLHAIPPTTRPSARPRSGVTLVPRAGPVRPQALMAAMQNVVVESSDALVMAEPGNSFAWTNHHLRFAAPRYRMSGTWASMGHMSTGAVGAALATDRPVVVVTGDGSMMMQNEISSAAQYGAKVVWIVLNDARYGITEAGMSAQGFTPVETRFPRTDFVAFARALGADGLAVNTEHDLEGALELALAKNGPFVVDVEIDTNERAPFLRRIQALSAMGANR